MAAVFWVENDTSAVQVRFTKLYIKLGPKHCFLTLRVSTYDYNFVYFRGNELVATNFWKTEWKKMHKKLLL
jgi:hypothetical protein